MFSTQEKKKFCSVKNASKKPIKLTQLIRSAKTPVLHYSRVNPTFFPAFEFFT